jgi:hypothetical protein
VAGLITVGDVRGHFKENGYDMLHAFVGLDDSTLLVLGIGKMGHRGILVREAAKLAKHFM